jgi:hypothetical protein
VSIKNNNKVLYKGLISKNHKLSYSLLTATLIFCTSTVFASQIMNEQETITCSQLDKKFYSAVSYSISMNEPIYNVSSDSNAHSINFTIVSQKSSPLSWSKITTFPYPPVISEYSKSGIQKSGRHTIEIANLINYPEVKVSWHGARLKKIENTKNWIWKFRNGIFDNYYVCSTKIIDIPAIHMDEPDYIAHNFI